MKQVQEGNPGPIQVVVDGDAGQGDGGSVPILEVRFLGRGGSDEAPEEGSLKLVEFEVPATGGQLVEIGFDEVAAAIGPGP